MDVDSDNLAHVTFHQLSDVAIVDDLTTWHIFLPYEGQELLLNEELFVINLAVPNGIVETL